MTNPTPLNTHSWTKWGVILAVVIGTPATVLALLQLSDRFGDDESTPPSSTSTSVGASPPTTTDPADNVSTGPQPSIDTPVTLSQTASDQPPRQSPSASAATEAPPPIPMINRIQITTWAYEKSGLNTYIADNTGAKSITVYWRSFADGHEITGGCASSVRIQGPGTDEAKNESNCDSNNPGTTLKAQQPGVHTITVTVRQDTGFEFSESITVTVLPG